MKTFRIEDLNQLQAMYSELDDLYKKGFSFEIDLETYKPFFGFGYFFIKDLNQLKGLYSELDDLYKKGYAFEIDVKLLANIGDDEYISVSIA